MTPTTTGRSGTENKSEPKMKMLIIDDDPSFGMVLQAVAQSQGFYTHYVTSLLDLGSFARIKEFDVAVIDYYLGNLRGDEIAEYVDMFFQNIPVLIVSSNSFSNQDIEKWPSCVRRFVSKSEGPVKIIDKVKRVLERDQLLKRLEQRSSFGRGQMRRSSARDLESVDTTDADLASLAKAQAGQ
jgi:DNA-binding NtrC family response regulator